MKKHIAIVEVEPALRENTPPRWRDRLSGQDLREPPQRDAGFKITCRISRSSTSRSRTKPKEASTVPRTARDVRRAAHHFFTARDSELDAVSGLRLGADEV